MNKGVTMNLFQFLTSFWNIPAMAALLRKLVVLSTCRSLQVGAPARAGCTFVSLSFGSPGQCAEEESGA